MVTRGDIALDRRALGRTGILSPAVGVGTYRVFNATGDAQVARCEAVVDVALAGGANLFDSSPMYGNAEAVLAGALSECRTDALIATKVWARTRAVGEGQIERALSWFEHVDIYQIHNLLAVADHLPYLRHLKEGGRITAIGATHYLPSAFPDLLAMMRHREIDVVQVPYHPLSRDIEEQILPEAEARGIGVIAMTPLGSGHLLSRAPDDEALAPLRPFGVHTWPQALLKWALSDSRVHVVIPATSHPDHMYDNLVAGAPPFFTGEERTYVRRLAQRLYG